MRINIRKEEKVSSVIERASSAWALVPEDWNLYYGLKQLGDKQPLKRYLDGWGSTAFRLEPKAVSCSLANLAQSPSSRVKRQSSPEVDPFLPVNSPPSGGSSTEASSLMPPAHSPGTPGISARSSAARITALKELNDASQKLEMATTSEQHVTTAIDETTERKRQLDEALVNLEAKRVEASESIAEAKRAMRAAWEKMGAALGGRTR